MAFKPKYGRIVTLALVEALLLAGMWRMGTRQLEGVNRAVNDIADLRDPSPFRAALMGHLGKIRIALQGYLRSGDASLLDQVTQSRKDFYASLPEFTKLNPQLFPKVAVEEILRNFNIYKESIDNVLAADERRMGRRGTLDHNFTRIVQLIDKDVKPLIRGDQMDNEQRKEGILNVENQARAWQQNLAKAWAQPTPAAIQLTEENDNRGESYLDRYGRLELLPRERKIQREISSLWRANSDLVRESFAMERIVKESEDFMDIQRGQVVETLNRYLPAMPPPEIEARKRGFVRSMRLHLAAAVTLGILGLVTLRFAIVGALRLNRGEPLFPPRPREPEDDSDPMSDALASTTLQMDLKGVITDWTAAAAALYGYSNAEMRGKTISKLFESESEISRLYRGLLEAPQTTFETIHKTKNGHAIPVRIEFRPIADATGHPKAIGLVCTRR